VTAKRSRIVPLLWQVCTVAILLALCTVAILLALWQWAALNRPAPHLPLLQNIAAGYIRLWHGDLLFSAIIPSLSRLAIGFLMAVAAGCVLGLMLGYLKGLDPWIRPVLEYLRFIPAVAILPAASCGGNSARRAPIVRSYRYDAHLRHRIRIRVSGFACGH